MKIVVQRVNKASVMVDKKIIGEIAHGLCVFVAFKEGDNEKIIDKFVKKIINLRIFDDENGIMNKNIIDSKGSILSISQFTLYAEAKKGNRPSYVKALNGKEAIEFYDMFNKKLKEYNISIETGIFGADMQVSLVNNGPVTIIIDLEEVA